MAASRPYVQSLAALGPPTGVLQQLLAIAGETYRHRYEPSFRGAAGAPAASGLAQVGVAAQHSL